MNDILISAQVSSESSAEVIKTNLYSWNVSKNATQTKEREAFSVIFSFWHEQLTWAKDAKSIQSDVANHEGAGILRTMRLNWYCVSSFFDFPKYSIHLPRLKEWRVNISRIPSEFSTNDTEAVLVTVRRLISTKTAWNVQHCYVGMAACFIQIAACFNELPEHRHWE